MSTAQLLDRPLTIGKRITFLLGFVLGWKWVGLRVAMGVPLVFGTGYFINHLARSGDIAALRRQLRGAARAWLFPTAPVGGCLHPCIRYRGAGWVDRKGPSALECCMSNRER
jgi:hypothetical protein